MHSCARTTHFSTIYDECSRVYYIKVGLYCGRMNDPGAEVRVRSILQELLAVLDSPVHIVHNGVNFYVVISAKVANFCMS